MVSNIIIASQIVIAVLLVISILIQAKGVGLGATFGGEGSFYRSKRGVEKLLVYLTVTFAILFFAISIVGVLVSR